MANEDQPRKLSRGRQKVAMAKMENESNLQVTFSKRRTGLFKKASELCTLCGAEVALVVFSPGKKVFSFGHPSVEAILDRYTGGAGLALGCGGAAKPEAPPAAVQLIEAHRSASLRDLNLQLTQVAAQVDAERKRGEAMARQRRAAMARLWWETPVELIDDEAKLLELHRALRELMAAVSLRTDRLLADATAPFYGGAAGGRHATNTNMVVPYNNNGNMSVMATGFGSGESSSSGSGAMNNGIGHIPYDNITINNQLGSYGRSSGFY